MRVSLRKLFEKVNSLRRVYTRNNITGKSREEIVTHVLQSLKKEGEIRDFIRTSSSENVGWADLIEGIDFYVVKINSQYRVFAISVTGPSWVDAHLSRHPEVPIVIVDLKDKDVFQRTREQFLKIFNDSAH
jgi:hypothetical protein